MKRHSLIEILVGIIFVTVLIMIALPVLMGPSNSNLSIGINGLMESRCVEGYRFIVDQDGRSRQILDEFGKGVRCENPNAGKPGAFGKM
jgi:competence protein ComGC